MESREIAAGCRCSLAGRPGTITEVFDGDSVAIVFDDDADRVMVVDLDDVDLVVE